MALPTSGSLSIKNAAGNDRSIAYCVDGNITGNKSLLSLSTTAGVNGCIRAFYGFAGVGSIAVSLSPTTNSSGQIAINTLTASGAWTASKISDPDSIVQSFTSSGSGSQKITAGLTGLINPFSTRSATIRYCLTSNPSITDDWVIVIPDGQ